MTISFDAIPIDIRTPGSYIEIDNTQAVRGLPGIPSRILILGQRLAAGSVAEATPTRVLDAEDAEVFFGRGSQLHRMVKALKTVNSYTECWAIALDDAGAGVAATGTPADIAAKVAAAINAVSDLPLTAVVNGVTAEQVDLTARHKGLNGNDIDVRINYYTGEKTPAGLTVTIVGMANGAANPDIATAIAAFGDEWYTDIVMPWTDAANLTALETELASRFGPLVMMDGHAYAAATDTHANLTTLGNGRNSPHLTIMGNDGSPTPPDEWAATLTGVCAYHGKIDPARPFQTLPLTGILPPAEDKRFTQAERNLLLNDGIATFKVDDGGRVLIERVITTYQTNAQSVADPSYLDLNTMKTLALLRYTVRARIAMKFPRHKLASDGTQYGEGQAIVTPRVIRAELIALMRDWEAAGLAEGMEQFKADLIVERDASDVNRVNALIPPDVVNQFRVFAGKVQFRL